MGDFLQWAVLVFINLLLHSHYVDLKDLNMEGLLDLFSSQIEALWALLVFVNLLLHSHKD